MAHPLDGVQAKIDRSYEHLDLLVKQIGVFLDPENAPYSLDTMVEGKWRIDHFRTVREPPLRLSAIAGDFAQNLRAALDHLVYQLAKLTTKSPHGTQFPIALTEREYLVGTNCRPCMRDRYLVHLRPEHRTMIDEVQPYRRHAPPVVEWDPLILLSRFANTDKHRLIHAMFGQMTSASAEVIGGSATVELIHPDPLPVLTEGTEVYRFRVTEVSDPEVHVKTTITFTMAFGRYMLDEGNFRDIHRDVVGIIDRFRPIFG